jgi:tetratricopeptide (TPR) repeat protein
MNKLLLTSLLVVFAIVGCQKEEPKPQFDFPSGPVGGGGPIQSMDQTKMLQEAIAKDPKNINALISLGNMMMDTKRFNEAIDAYQKALAIDPKNVDVRVDLGTCYRNSGQPDLAVKEYRKALELNPRHLNAHKNLGVVLAYDLKDVKQAAKEFEAALAIEPNAPDAGQLRQEIEKLKAMK